MRNFPDTDIDPGKQRVSLCFFFVCEARLLSKSYPIAYATDMN